METIVPGRNQATLTPASTTPTAPDLTLYGTVMNGIRDPPRPPAVDDDRLALETAMQSIQDIPGITSTQWHDRNFVGCSAFNSLQH